MFPFDGVADVFTDAYDVDDFSDMLKQTKRASRRVVELERLVAASRLMVTVSRLKQNGLKLDDSSLVRHEANLSRLSAELVAAQYDEDMLTVYRDAVEEYTARPIVLLSEVGNISLLQHGDGAPKFDPSVLYLSETGDVFRMREDFLFERAPYSAPAFPLENLPSRFFPLLPVVA